MKAAKNTYTNLNLLKPHPEMSLTTFTKMNNEKRLVTSKTQKNFLLPIKGKHKYDNAVLFELREINMKEKNKKNIPSLKQRTKSRSPSKNNFYLTESQTLNNAFYSNEKSTTKESDTNNPINTGGGTNFLKEITDERTTDKINTMMKEKNPQLERKNSVMNVKRNNSIRDYISKTREIVLMKYTTEIKKERAIRLQETYNNEVEAIKDTIQSMEEAKKLFNDKFLSKFTEYVKYLTLQREEEKTIDSGLVDQIIKLKNEILALENKKKKIDSDKASLGRWMYLQIQIKEKKLSLPFYYKLLLEREDNELYSNNIFKTGISYNLLKSVSKEEKDRIMKYKYCIIYSNASDFLEEFIKFENKNILLIEQYNSLREEVRELKNERDVLINEDNKAVELLTNETQSKEKKLAVLMKKHQSLLKDKNSILNIDQTNTINNKRRKRAPSADTKRGMRNKLNQTKLYSKILEVYNNICEEKRIPIQMILKKGNMTSEMEMINMLAKIELGLDELNTKNRVYLNGPRAGEYKLIQIQIEKEHKIKKTILQREAQLRKIELLKEKIEERNNKIYVLPLKKVDKYYSIFAKKDKKRKNNNNTNSEPQFDDFMYDVNEQ